MSNLKTNKLNENDLEYVSGGNFFSNTVFNDNDKKFMTNNLGKAEKEIDRSRLFTKLDDYERKTETNQYIPRNNFGNVGSC